MSTPRHIPIPPEVEEAIRAKPIEAQERLRQVWHLLGRLEFEDEEGEDLDIPDTESALADIERTIDARPVSGQREFARDRSPRQRAGRSKTPFRIWTTGVAFSLIALFAVVTWYWRTPITISAPHGAQITALLPDGSTVTLNSGSRLEHARRFESWPFIPTTKRRVFLQGEAFFEVEKMQKPFLVESFNAQIRVLGTAFNVWAREQDDIPETRVTLSHGVVLVTPHAQEEQRITLDQEGQMARITSALDGKTESLSDEAPIDRVTSWRSQGFFAMDMSIASIVYEIERRYNIVVDLDEAIDSTIKLTFYIHEKPTPEGLLENICLSNGCQFRQTNNGFYIFPQESASS